MSETICQPSNQYILKYILNDLGYSNHQVSEVKNGDVHFIYKISTDTNQNIFVKIRRSHFRSNPNISINPTDIIYEKKAIDLVNQYCPEVAPKIIKFYKHFSTLCLEDVSPDHTKTVTDLITESNPSDYKLLGNFVGHFHSSLAKCDLNIRNKLETKFYQDSLYYRLGFLNIPAISQLIDNLSLLPRQNIHGDLTPWNIVWNKDVHSFRLYDLETIHQGNTLFDISFIEAHIILETSSDPKKMLELISSFRSGYQQYLPIEDESLEVRLALALTYFRLNSQSGYQIQNKILNTTQLSKSCLNFISHPRQGRIIWKHLDI